MPASSAHTLRSHTVGWEGCRVAQDDVIWKRPNVYPNSVVPDSIYDNNTGSGDKAAKSTIGFHQDSSYISYNFVPYKASSCTLWIALDDSGPANGGLTYALGSHAWDCYDVCGKTGARKNRGGAGATFMSAGAFTDPLAAALALHNAATGEGLELGGVRLETPEVGRGGALLHLQDTWHGSAGNESETRERRAIAVHFIEAGSRFRPAEGGGAGRGAIVITSTAGIGGSGATRSTAASCRARGAPAGRSGSTATWTGAGWTGGR